MIAPVRLKRCCSLKVKPPVATVKSPMASTALFSVNPMLAAAPFRVPAVMALVADCVIAPLEVSDTACATAFSAPVRVKP